MSNHSMDLFLEACGADGPLELTVESPGTQEPMPRVLYQPFVLIGREPRATLLLNHADVSRRHTYLQLMGGRVFCVDLQSRTGTHWETGAKRSGWLDPRQAIRVGPYWIRPRSISPRSGTKPEPAAELQALPEVTLEISNRSARSSTWQMTPLLALVGKSPECRVHLVGDSVSSMHCSLVRTPLGLWVVDLLGRGGIEVNDLVVRCAQLEDGDRLQVGKFLIRVHYDRRPQPGTLSAFRPEFPAVRWEQPEPAAPPADDIPVSPLNSASPELVLSPTPTALPPAAAGTEPPAAAGRDLMVLPPEQPPVNGDAAQALLVPVARQLGLMQQQMFDQFQQAMMMMFQMFNTLQRDQIGVIRQELDHLHKLTEELQTLQVELSQRAAPPPPPTAATRDSTSRSAATRGHPANWANAAGRAPAGASAPDGRPQAPPVPKPGPAPTAPAVAAPPPPAPAAPLPEQGDPAFHVYLAERIAAIQEERQTRWQKVVNFLNRQ